MSAMRKMGVYLGLLEDADGDYADPENEYDEPARRAEPRSEHESARPVANLSERRRPGVDRGGTGPAADHDGGADVADHDAAPAHLQRGPRDR